MKLGILMRDVDTALEKAADTLRFARAIEARIVRVAASGERESLWRWGFGSF